MSINDLEVTGPDTGPDNQVNTHTEVNTKQNASEETTYTSTNQNISFNSGDIKKTSFEGLFTNVKGEDARKKAEERQQEAHDKELDRRRKEFQNQLKQQEKHSEAEPANITDASRHPTSVMRIFLLFIVRSLYRTFHKFWSIFDNDI